MYDFIGIEINKLKFKKNILRQTAGRNHNKLHAYSFKAYVTFNLTKSHRSVTNVVPWKCFAIKGIGRSDDIFARGFPGLMTSDFISLNFQSSNHSASSKPEHGCHPVLNIAQIIKKKKKLKYVQG